jgi:hypothetical protein
MNKEHFSFEYVQNISNTLKMNKIKCYEIFLNEIKKLIINKAKQGDSNLYYHIPPFKLGVPPYNKEDCAIYLHDKLRDMKFEVEIIKKKTNNFVQQQFQNNNLNEYYLLIKWDYKPTTPTNETSTNKQKTLNMNKYTYIHSNGVVDVLPVNNNYKKPNTIHI